MIHPCLMLPACHLFGHRVKHCLRNIVSKIVHAANIDHSSGRAARLTSDWHMVNLCLDLRNMKIVHAANIDHSSGRVALLTPDWWNMKIVHAANVESCLVEWPESPRICRRVNLCLDLRNMVSRLWPAAEFLSLELLTVRKR